MGLLDTLSSLFSGKKTNVQNTIVETAPQVQNTPQQTTPVTDTTTTLPPTPIEEPASVKSIDDLLKENLNTVQQEVNVSPVEQTVTTEIPTNPAEPAPGIGTTHTPNSLHANETNTDTQDSNRVKDISL